MNFFDWLGTLPAWGQLAVCGGIIVTAILAYNGISFVGWDKETKRLTVRRRVNIKVVDAKEETAQCVEEREHLLLISKKNNMIQHIENHIKLFRLKCHDIFIGLLQEQSNGSINDPYEHSDFKLYKDLLLDSQEKMKEYALQFIERNNFDSYNLNENADIADFTARANPVIELMIAERRIILESQYVGERSVKRIDEFQAIEKCRETLKEILFQGFLNACREAVSIKQKVDKINQRIKKIGV